MFTCIDFIHSTDSTWSATIDFVARLIKHFEAEKALYVTGFSRPVRWDDDYERWRIFELHHVSIRKVMSKLKEGGAACVLLGLICPQWQRDLADDLNEYAESNAWDGYLPNAPSVTIGNHTFPDGYGEETAGEANFTVSLCGDGSPKKPDEYLERALRSPRIAALRAFLKEETAVEWKAFMNIT